MNHQKKKNDIGLGTIFITIILSSIALPIGVCYLLYKLGVFEGISRFFTNQSSSGDAQSRYARYMVYTDYAESVSVSFLSSALDIPYPTVIKDLSKMVAEKRFGEGAYIDYARGMLILSPGAKKSSASWTASDAKHQATQVKKQAPASAKKKESARAQAEKKSDKKKNAVEKEPKAFSPVLGGVLIAAAALMLISGAGLIFSAVDAAAAGHGFLYDLGMGILFALGGVAALLGRGSLKRRSRRYRKYAVIAKNTAAIELTELASQAGVSVSNVIRDLEDMIERGWFGADTYIDSGRMLLVIDPARAPKQEETAAQESGSETKERYDAILAQIRQLDDDIADEAVSERIREIEKLTGSIFQIVLEKPEKLPQIKSFMSYYLPTTLKLLNSYALLERQGVSGENIRSARERIENILDSLVNGFSQQLDQLFKSDAMDISTDIDVLESMMAKDGLSDDQSGFKTASRGGQ